MNENRGPMGNPTMHERTSAIDVSTVTPETLATLTDDEYRAVVDADLRSRTPRGSPLSSEVSAALRSPEQVPRWYATLTRLAKSIDGQLGARADDYKGTVARIQVEVIAEQYYAKLGHSLGDEEGARRHESKLKDLQMRLASEKVDYLKTRAGTIRFKTGLDQLLLEARYLLSLVQDALYTTAVVRERDYWASRARRLRLSIEQHYEGVQQDGEVAEEADKVLWQALERSA